MKMEDQKIVRSGLIHQEVVVDRTTHFEMGSDRHQKVAGIEV